MQGAQEATFILPTMAPTQNNYFATAQDDHEDADLMNGGPVRPFSGQYVNGTSTPGTGSPPATPKVDAKARIMEDVPPPRPSPRAGTWPGSPPPPPAEMSPEAQAFAASHPNASHQIPALGPHETEAGGPRSRPFARVHEYRDDGIGGPEARFPRLSRPVELLRRSYDCVVIGSGYGGAVAASRVARAGESVCVLERGREKWPGEYPSGMESAADELHWSGSFSPSNYVDSLPVNGGDPTGMYHLIFGKGQNAVVCNGELRKIRLWASECLIANAVSRSRRNELDERQRLPGGKP